MDSSGRAGEGGSLDACAVWFKCAHAPCASFSATLRQTLETGELGGRPLSFSGRQIALSLPEPLCVDQAACSVADPFLSCPRCLRPVLCEAEAAPEFGRAEAQTTPRRHFLALAADRPSGLERRRNP